MRPFAMAAGAALVALAVAPAHSHSMTYGPGGATASAAGVVTVEVANAFDAPAEIGIFVLDHETAEAIPSDQWRSDLEDDLVTLLPGEWQAVRVQFRSPGRYRVCSVVEGGVRTMVCAPVTARTVMP